LEHEYGFFEALPSRLIGLSGWAYGCGI